MQFQHSNHAKKDSNSSSNKNKVLFSYQPLNENCNDEAATSSFYFKNTDAGNTNIPATSFSELIVPTSKQNEDDILSSSNDNSSESSTVLEAEDLAISFLIENEHKSEPLVSTLYTSTQNVLQKKEKNATANQKIFNTSTTKKEKSEFSYTWPKGTKQSSPALSSYLKNRMQHEPVFKSINEKRVPPKALKPTVQVPCISYADINEISESKLSEKLSNSVQFLFPGNRTLSLPVYRAFEETESKDLSKSILDYRNQSKKPEIIANAVAIDPLYQNVNLRKNPSNDRKPVSKCQTKRDILSRTQSAFHQVPLERSDMNTIEPHVSTRRNSKPKDLGTVWKTESSISHEPISDPNSVCVNMYLRLPFTASIGCEKVASNSQTDQNIMSLYASEQVNQATPGTRYPSHVERDFNTLTNEIVVAERQKLASNSNKKYSNVAYLEKYKRFQFLYRQLCMSRDKSVTLDRLLSCYENGCRLTVAEKGKIQIKKSEQNVSKSWQLALCYGARNFKDIDMRNLLFYGSLVRNFEAHWGYLRFDSFSSTSNSSLKNDSFCSFYFSPNSLLATKRVILPPECFLNNNSKPSSTEKPHNKRNRLMKKQLQNVQVALLEGTQYRSRFDSCKLHVCPNLSYELPSFKKNPMDRKVVYVCCGGKDMVSLDWLSFVSRLMHYSMCRNISLNVNSFLENLGYYLSSPDETQLIFSTVEKTGTRYVEVEWPSIFTCNTCFVLVEYPGYGLSEGDTNPDSCIDAATAALLHTLDRIDSDNIEIRLIGFSLGAAVALKLAFVIASEIEKMRHDFASPKQNIADDASECSESFFSSTMSASFNKNMRNSSHDVSKTLKKLNSSIFEYTASQKSALSKIRHLRQLVLVAPFTTITDCVISFLNIPNAMQWLAGSFVSMIQHEETKWDNVEITKQLFQIVESCPEVFKGFEYLVFHGSEDTMVPPKMGQALISTALKFSCSHSHHVTNFTKFDRKTPVTRELHYDSCNLCTSGVRVEYYEITGADHKSICTEVEFQESIFAAMSEPKNFKKYFPESNKK